MESKAELPPLNCASYSNIFHSICSFSVRNALIIEFYPHVTPQYTTKNTKSLIKDFCPFVSACNAFDSDFNNSICEFNKSIFDWYLSCNAALNLCFSKTVCFNEETSALSRSFSFFNSASLYI